MSAVAIGKEWRGRFADEMEDHLAKLAAPGVQAQPALMSLAGRKLSALLEPLTAEDRRMLCEYAALLAAKRVVA